MAAQGRLTVLERERAVRQAIADYHFALDNREHGGVAMGRAIAMIEEAFGMSWVQGAETKRRNESCSHDYVEGVEVDGKPVLRCMNPACRVIVHKIREGGTNG